MTVTAEQADLSAGVLVIGGGLAGTWAALSAAEQGADVILVDKGYCGTSGVTATGSAVITHSTSSSGNDSRSIMCQSLQKHSLGPAGRLQTRPCRSAHETKSRADRTPTQCPPASTTGAPLTSARSSTRAAVRNDMLCGMVTTVGLIKSAAVSSRSGLDAVVMANTLVGETLG